MITLHDPSDAEIRLTCEKLTGGVVSPTDDFLGWVLDQIERRPNGFFPLNYLMISWAEPDHTGMTPVTITRIRTLSQYGA